MSEHTVLSVDYHDQTSVIRDYASGTGAERVQSVPTDPTALRRVVEQAAAGGRAVIWIQESTTGWARVKELLGPHVHDFLLANVLQLPRRPKEGGKKTDRLDTQRVLHEYLLGRLVTAWQPEPAWRQARRVVAWREDLVSRRTALRNWLNRYLAHETWIDRTGLWSVQGQARWRELLPRLPASDQVVIAGKRAELEHLAGQLEQAQQQLLELYRRWPAAQRLDAIKGISVIAAVSILARIGPIERFPNAEALIAYAGLAPGVRQSDQTRHDGHLGGGGTDGSLRHYLVEASVWARHVPRYRPAYERVARRRGPRVGRLHVCRMMLRSIDKLLRHGVAFDPAPPVSRPAPARG